MSIPVVVATVYSPRPNHPKFVDYLPFIRAQKASAQAKGHKHVVVTDTDLGNDLRQIRTPLSADLMPAMIEGVIAGLKASNGKCHMVFLDADCLVNKWLDRPFDGEWDIALTRRDSQVSPINNGAMFVNAAGVGKAIPFFERALSLCGTHWGADQEAISQAAVPVPPFECVEDREGFRIAFVSMKTHAAVPAEILARHDSYIVHFKGEKKAWMLEYAKRFLML